MPPPPPPSAYRLCRPLMVLCFLAGLFPVVNVFVDSSARLQFKYLSWSFLIHSLINASRLLYPLVTKEGAAMYTILMIACHIVYRWGLHQWFIVRTEPIVRSIQELDNLELSLCSVPPCIRPTLTTPTLFRWLTVAMFLCIPLLSVFFVSYFIQDSFDTHFGMFYFSLPHYKVCLALSLVLHYRGRAVHDMTGVWTNHVSGCLYTRTSLKDVSQLVVRHSLILRRLMILLEAHLFIVVLSFLERFLFGICLDSFHDVPESANLFNLAHSLVVFWLLVLSACQTSIKVEDLKEEIFSTRLSAKDLTRRDVARLKTVLVQLEEDPGQASAAGYANFDMDDCLWFLSLSIEYLVFLWQNKLAIRNFFMTDFPAR